MAVVNGVEIAGDFLKRFGDPEYVFKSVLLIADTLGADVENADIAGLPVLDNGDGTADLLLNAATNTANAFIAQKGKLTLADGATTTEKYLICVRGPAVVHDTGYPATDPVGTTFNQGAAFKTVLEGLSPPVIVNERATALEEIQLT